MDSFFAIQIDPTSIIGMTAVLILSVLIGGLVGLEREIHGHPAGLRTHILVCLGSTLMTLVSMNQRGGGDDRIAAQVVTGVGFLGAGAIVREGVSVRGLTTAASIWATAGIGIALGASPHFGQIGLIAALIVLFTLWALNRMEDVIDLRAGRPVVLHVVTSDAPRAMAEVVACVAEHGLAIKSMEMPPDSQPHERNILLRVTRPANFVREKFVADLSEIRAVRGAHLD